jgi:hypothetical protein
MMEQFLLLIAPLRFRSHWTKAALPFCTTISGPNRDSPYKQEWVTKDDSTVLV